MKKTGSSWSVPVAVEDIPDTGLHIEIDVPAATRAEVAQLAALRELPQLSAVFDLTRQGTGVHVSGQVSARVGQTCVVTLEPIESVVEETVERRRRAARTAGRRHLGSGRVGDRIPDPWHRPLSAQGRRPVRTT